MTDDIDTTAEVTVPSLTNPARTELVVIVLSGPESGRHYKVVERDSLLGRSERAAIVLSDPFVSREHAKIERTESGTIIRDLGSHFGTYVEGERVNVATLRDGHRIHLSAATVLCVRFQDPREAEIFDQAQFAAIRDGLTGAYNRRYFTDRLDQEYSFARRHNAPLSVLMIDIDGFKAINDELGHRAGDSAIQAIARTLHEALRREDVLARYGGDEFVIICRSPTTSAVLLADRLLRATRRRPTLVAGVERNITISIGVAGIGGPVEQITHHAADDLVSWADAALYASKREGKNRVTVWTPPAPQEQGIRRGETMEMTVPEFLRGKD